MDSIIKELINIPCTFQTKGSYPFTHENENLTTNTTWIMDLTLSYMYSVIEKLFNLASDQPPPDGERFTFAIGNPKPEHLADGARVIKNDESCTMLCNNIILSEPKICIIDNKLTISFGDFVTGKVFLIKE